MKNRPTSQDPTAAFCLANLRAYCGAAYPGDPSEKQVDSSIAAASLVVVTNYIVRLEQRCSEQQTEK